MADSLFSEALAREIVTSWSTARSNYIIVSPPMSNSRSLLHQVGNADFIRHHLANARIQVAELDTNDFKDDIAFARRVLKSWKIPLTISGDECDPVTLLNLGTEEVIRRNEVPVIIIHRFHEALQKLGEEIGTALRNLEHDHHLKTVVELPISLTCLRERWAAMNSQAAPFLASDWGQGHTTKLLKGYTEGEIIALLGTTDTKEELSASIMKMTGGLVGLVEKLIDPARSRNVSGLEKFAQAQAGRWCERLLNWIDKPTDNFYKELLVKTWSNPRAVTGATRLNDHDWSELLLHKSGEMSCLLVVWACSAQLSGTHLDSHINHFESSQDPNSIERFASFIKGQVPNTKLTQEKQKALLLLYRLSIVSGPYVHDWHEADTLLDDLSLLAKDTDCADISKAWDSISAWRDLCVHMCSYSYARRLENDLRLEEYSLSKGHDGICCLLQLLQLRLNHALTLSPFLALKSVVEQPESLLQLYASAIGGICFWNFPGLSAEDAENVSRVTKKPFRSPAKNQPLGFIEILYITFYKSEKMPEDQKLFGTYQDLLRIEDLYNERKRQVHSTGLVSDIEWQDYKLLCSEWINKLWIISNGEHELTLKSPKNVFLALAKSLKS